MVGFTGEDMKFVEQIVINERAIPVYRRKSKSLESVISSIEPVPNPPKPLAVEKC